MRLVGSERNRTHCRVPGCRVPSPAEFRSHPEGIRKVGVRRSSTGELFFVREPSHLDIAPPFQHLYLVPTSDIPSMEFSPDERGGREKLKSHQWAIIVSPVSRATPQKLNNLRGLTSAMSRSLYLSLPPIFPSIFFCSPIRWFLPSSLRRILVDTCVTTALP